VLLVDADPQANLTDHLGVDASATGTSLYDVLTEGAPAAEALVATATPGLWVLPSDEDLAAVEQELATEMAREMRLSRALSLLDAECASAREARPGRFDLVLIDCPPSLGLLSLNAMAAADDLLVTVQTEYFAMRGLGKINEIVALVREHVNPRLRILGVLCTLVNPVTRLAREVVEEIEGFFGPQVLRTRIRQNVRLAEAPGHQQHIFDYDPGSAGAADYAAAALEIGRRLDGVEPGTPDSAEEAPPRPDDAPAPPEVAPVEPRAEG
jgi:chromosome partitioning protein